MLEYGNTMKLILALHMCLLSTAAWSGTGKRVGGRLFEPAASGQQTEGGMDLPAHLLNPEEQDLFRAKINAPRSRFHCECVALHCLCQNPHTREAVLIDQAEAKNRSRILYSKARRPLRAGKKRGVAQEPRSFEETEISKEEYRRLKDLAPLKPGVYPSTNIWKIEDDGKGKFFSFLYAKGVAVYLAPFARGDDSFLMAYPIRKPIPQGILKRIEKTSNKLRDYDDVLQELLKAGLVDPRGYCTCATYVVEALK